VNYGLSDKNEIRQLIHLCNIMALPLHNRSSTA